MKRTPDIGSHFGKEPTKKKVKKSNASQPYIRKMNNRRRERGDMRSSRFARLNNLAENKSNEIEESEYRYRSRSGGPIDNNRGKQDFGGGSINNNRENQDIDSGPIDSGPEDNSQETQDLTTDRNFGGFDIGDGGDDADAPVFFSGAGDDHQDVPMQPRSGPEFLTTRNLHFCISETLKTEIKETDFVRYRMMDYIDQFPSEIQTEIINILERGRNSQSLSLCRTDANKNLFVKASLLIETLPPFIPLFRSDFFHELDRDLNSWELWWLSKTNDMLSELLDINIQCLTYTDYEWKRFFGTNDGFSWSNYSELLDDYDDINLSDSMTLKDFLISQTLRYATSNVTKEDIDFNIGLEKLKFQNHPEIQKRFPKFQTVIKKIMESLKICFVPYCKKCSSYFNIRYDFKRKRFWGEEQANCLECSSPMFSKRKGKIYANNVIPYVPQKDVEIALFELAPKYKTLMLKRSREFLQNPTSSKFFKCKQGERAYHHTKTMIRKRALEEDKVVLHLLEKSYDGVKLKKIKKENNYIALKEILAEDQRMKIFIRLV